VSILDTGSPERIPPVFFGLPRVLLFALRLSAEHPFGTTNIVATIIAAKMGILDGGRFIVDCF
jgi:hypothetical protein